MTRIVLVVLATLAGVLAIAPAAQAFTTLPVWQCRGSAAYSSVAGQNRVEPIVANGNTNTANGVSPDRAQCVNSETGLGNTATQVGISPDFLAAVTGKASTSITPELGRAIDQRITAEGRVEDLTLPLGGTSVVLGIGAANSTAEGHCVPGNRDPVFSGDSRVADITLGGTAIPLDRLTQALSDLLRPLDMVVEITSDERVVEPSRSLTIRALHIKVLRSNDPAPVVDLVVGEAKVGSNGPVCDPARQNDGSGNIPACPPGSVLDQVRVLCIIPATSGSSFGEIIVGRPFEGPSGGRVVPLDIARRRFGRSPCLSGRGRPLFVIVGTNRNDRLTGTNLADRILGLRGNDRVSGGRGNDCMEGGAGRDILSGSLGADRIFGQAGNDALNGAGGNDRLSAGSGNDTINAGYGRDRAMGGPGRDAINIATQGPRASADCGGGRGDKVRFNLKEGRGVRNCETRYAIRDR